MTVRKLLYVVTQPPYSNAVGQEALDAALIGASFEQRVSLLFVQDGVFQLKAGQDVGGTDIKEFTKTYKALGDFGIEQVYVHDLSMAARGLSESELMIDVNVIDKDAVTKLIADQFRVFTF